MLINLHDFFYAAGLLLEYCKHEDELEDIYKPASQQNYQMQLLSSISAMVNIEDRQCIGSFWNPHTHYFPISYVY